jgi:hypothetical protein
MPNLGRFQKDADGQWWQLLSDRSGRRQDIAKSVAQNFRSILPMSAIWASIARGPVRIGPRNQAAANADPQLPIGAVDAISENGMVTCMF